MSLTSRTRLIPSYVPRWVFWPESSADFARLGSVRVDASFTEPLRGYEGFFHRELLGWPDMDPIHVAPMADIHNSPSGSDSSAPADAPNT